jgi:hypothetical protein
MVGELSKPALDILLKRNLLGNQGIWIGRPGKGNAADRFCIADTEDEAERWSRLTCRELEGRVDA